MCVCARARARVQSVACLCACVRTRGARDACVCLLESSERLGVIGLLVCKRVQDLGSEPQCADCRGSPTLDLRPSRDADTHVCQLDICFIIYFKSPQFLPRTVTTPPLTRFDCNGNNAPRCNGVNGRFGEYESSHSWQLSHTNVAHQRRTPTPCPCPCSNLILVSNPIIIASVTPSKLPFSIA